MNPGHRRDGPSPSILKYIRLKCRAAGHLCGPAMDADDFAQELALDWIRRVRDFDPTRSTLRTFTVRIVRNRIATLIQAQRAALRDYRRCPYSLQVPVQNLDGESVEFADTISTDRYEAILGRSSRAIAEQLELQMDVARVISLLSVEDAKLGDLLMYSNGTEAAKRLGVSRSTLCRRILRLRRAFERARLEIYLGHVVPQHKRGEISPRA